MELESNEWVEQTLRDAERRQGIAKVLSMESEEAVAKGANYGSDMYRLRLRVVTGAGELETRSVVYKALPTTPHRREAMKKSGFFSTETKVYQDVFPEMKKTLKKRDPSGDLLWPNCYGIKGRSEGYLFEDLSAIGYKMGDRLKGLDFNEASFVVDSLAKFHALSAVVIENGDLSMSDFDGYHFTKAKELIDLVFRNNLKGLADVLEHNWKGEWVDYARRVREFRDCFTEKFLETFNGNTCMLKVLNHGDCWLNNMMFKYDGKGQPQQMRFLDFQLSYVGSPGGDLQYFFATSLRADDTSPRKRELLELYHAALDTYLQQFGYGGERLSLSELLETYDRFSTFGVGAGLAIRPLIMLPEADAPDIEKKSEELAKGEQVTLWNYDNQDEDFVNAIKFSLREGKEVGVL